MNRQISGDDNWRKVERARPRYLAAMFRHVVSWVTGEVLDPESGCHHLAHAICCLLFLTASELEAPALEKSNTHEG